jgi:hypothetical protein
MPGNFQRFIFELRRARPRSRRRRFRALFRIRVRARDGALAAKRLPANGYLILFFLYN